MSGTPADFAIIEALSVGAAEYAAADVALSYGLGEIGAAAAGSALAGEAAGGFLGEAAAADVALNYGGDVAAGALLTPETASLPAFAAGGVADAYAGSLTGQAADLMAAYGGNANAAFSGPSLIDTAKSALSIAGPAMSIGSGLMGMDSAMQQRKMAQMGLNQQPNMWQASGGQQQATGKLMQLMNDPTAASANDPSFKLMQESAMRANAQQGQTSGAVAKGAAMAANDWYGQRLAQYGGLAGAPGNATGAMQVGGQILNGSNNLMSQALASIGYGVTSATGGSTQIPPAVQQWLLQQKLSGGMVT